MLITCPLASLLPQDPGPGTARTLKSRECHSWKEKEKYIEVGIEEVKGRTDVTRRATESGLPKLGSLIAYMYRFYRHSTMLGVNKQMDGWMARTDVIVRPQCLTPAEGHTHTLNGTNVYSWSIPNQQNFPSFNSPTSSTFTLFRQPLPSWTVCNLPPTEKVVPLKSILGG